MSKIKKKKFNLGNAWSTAFQAGRNNDNIGLLAQW